MARLLIINSSAKAGSTGCIASSLAQTSARAGWDVELAHSSRFAPSASLPFPTYRIGSRLSETAHAFCCRAFDSHGLHSHNATQGLIAEIKRFAPDVISLHNVHGYYLNYPLLFSYLRQAGIPVVWTMHDLWAVTGHCAFPDAHSCTRWQSGCGHCPGLRSYPSSLWLDRSKRNHRLKSESFAGVRSLTIVAVSQWIQGELKRSFLAPYPSTVIRNGIDLDVFKPSKPMPVQAQLPLAVAAASRWTDRKGLRELLAVADKLRGKCDLMVAGLTRAQAEEAKKHGIMSLWHILKPEQMARLYSNADLFISASTGDNLPTTLMESMACGTPVVAFNTGGTAELVGTDCGELCEPGNVEALASAVMHVAERGRRAYFYACRRRAQRDFNERAAMREYLSLFNSLLTHNS